MDNLNNIPSTGSFGDVADKLNDNFNKVQNAITTVENTYKNNKGYFPSELALNTAFPNPKSGETAYVFSESSSTNYYIFNAVGGGWVTSSIEAPSVGVDIAEYTKTGGSTKTLKEVEDEIVQLAGEVSNIKGESLFQPIDFSADGALLFATGTVNPGAYKHTPKKWVVGGTKITLTAKGVSTIALIAVYDEGDTYIQSESIAGNNTLKTNDIVIQGDGRYVAMSTEDASVPNSYAINISEFLKKSEAASEYATLIESVKEEDLSFALNSNLAEMNVLSSKNDDKDGVFMGWLSTAYVPVDVADTSTYQWRTYKFNCINYQGQNLTFGTTNSGLRRWAFYNEDAQLAYGDYSVDAAYTVTVPVDATHLYIMLQRYSTDSFEYFRINLGDSLLPYELYNRRIVKIKGFNLGAIQEDTNSVSNYIPKTVRLYPKTKLPAVNFQFDWSGDISNNGDKLCAELFESYGNRCGFAIGGSIMTDPVVVNAYLNYQLRGHSILNHPGMTAFSLANFPTVQDAYDQIMLYQTQLIKQGFVINGFVAAGSQYDPSLIEAVEKVYAYGATYADAAVNGRTSSPCATSRFSLENTTSAAAKKRIKQYITGDKIAALYGHTSNFGVSGYNIPVITFWVKAVNLVDGAGTIEVQGSIPINAGAYAGVLTLKTGSGDASISFTNVTIDSEYVKNTLTVSGVTLIPAIDDTYTYQTSDEWNISKLEDILQFAIEQQSLRQCVVMPPDEAFQYYFNL